MYPLPPVTKIVLLLRNPKDQVKFIEAINFLIENPDKRYLLGKKARIFVEKKFNQRIDIEKFNKFLKRNLNID